MSKRLTVTLTATPEPQYNGQASRSQMNSLKQTLNKCHPYNYNGQNVVPQLGWPL